MCLLQHLDSPRRGLTGWKRRAAVLLTAMALLAALAAGGWLMLKRGTGNAEVLQLPDVPRSEYTLHLRYTEQGNELTVTEEIRWTNARTAAEKLCLHVNAAAYVQESTAPGAAADLYERAYPNGFDAAALQLEGCWVNDQLAKAEFDPEQRDLLWIDASAEPGETLLLKLRFRLGIPDCASLFGRADGVIRLVQALPAVAAQLDGGWDTFGLTPYAAPQAMDLSDVRITADLPEGWRMITGASMGTDQLAAVIVPETMSTAAGRTDGIPVTAWADTRERAERILSLSIRVWKVFSDMYGALPLDQLTLVSLPLTDSGYSAPGLVLLDESLTDAELEYRLAYWLAGQWFGWAVRADNGREGWITCAARQWAALQAVREIRGADAEAALRTLWVDLPMREDLHAAVTPGTPADGFPDLSTYRSVMDGRGAALFYALDTWTEGRLNGVLSRFIREHAFGRVTRADLSDAITRASGKDILPLMTDWLDTYMRENP